MRHLTLKHIMQERNRIFLGNLYHSSLSSLICLQSLNAVIMRQVLYYETIMRHAGFAACYVTAK